MLVFSFEAFIRHDTTSNASIKERLRALIHKHVQDVVPIEVSFSQLPLLATLPPRGQYFSLDWMWNNFRDVGFTEPEALQHQLCALNRLLKMCGVHTICVIPERGSRDTFLLKENEIERIASFYHMADVDVVVAERPEEILDNTQFFIETY